MKNIFFAIVFFSGLLEKWIGPSTQVDFAEIRSEIEWFIKKTKPESIQGGRYDVYLVKIYKGDERGFCVTMGIISDSLHVADLKQFKYCLTLNEDLVLLDFPDEFNIKLGSENTGISRLTDTNAISKKIYPGVAFLGITPGYVVCYESRNIVKMYYDNADRISYDKRIFKSIIENKAIRVDSTEMKHMLRKRKGN